MLTQGQVRRRLERIEELHRDMAPTAAMDELLAFLLEILPELVPATRPEARALDQTAIYHTRTCPDCIEGVPCHRAATVLSGGGK